MSKAAVAEAQRPAGGKTVEAAALEHVNVTTTSARETAQLMVEVFGGISAGKGRPSWAGTPSMLEPTVRMWRSTRRRKT